MAHQADRALAAALLRGDEREFERFFNDSFPRVYRFALTRVQGDEDLAQDLAQTTLVNAVRSLATYRGEASMFSWLCQICRNEISAHYRRLSRSVPTVMADDDAVLPLLERIESAVEDDPEAAAERVQLAVRVREVLDRLPTSYGDVLEWKYIRGDSVGEIAERLGVTPLAAQSLLARARGSFRDALGMLSQQLANG